MSKDCSAVFDRCMHRIRSWRAPLNYSRKDWLDEIEAEAAAEMWLALQSYDPSRNVPVGAFLYQRVLAGVLRRYRQEWSYAHRHSAEDILNQREPVASERSDNLSIAVRLAMSRLSHNDRKLLVQLYWADRTEMDIADELGISQQGVSKRKRSLLANLRTTFATPTASYP